MSKEAIKEKVEEEKDDPANPPKEEPKPSKKGKIMLLIALPVLLLLIGIGLYFSGALNGFLKKDPAPQESAEAAHPAAAPEIIYKQLEEFLVDLKTGSSASFIKIEIVLKLPDQASLKAVEDRLPVIRDSFISYLRELKSTDVYGSEGLFVLKQELLMRINKIVSPSSVDDIYIQNILTR